MVPGRLARIACSALSTRLSTTCWISSRLTRPISGPGAARSVKRDVALARGGARADRAVARAIWFRSAATRSGELRRTNASRLRTIWPARVASCRTSLEIARLPAPGRSSIISSTQPMMVCSGLLISCATPGDELADRRQPLAVHQLIAQLQLLGDVALDADEVRHAPLTALRSATTVLEAGNVVPSLRRRDQRAAPDALLAGPRLPICARRSDFEAASAARERHAVQLVAAVAEGVEARVVGVLELRRWRA